MLAELLAFLDAEYITVLLQDFTVKVVVFFGIMLINLPVSAYQASGLPNPAMHQKMHVVVVLSGSL